MDFHPFRTFSIAVLLSGCVGALAWFVLGGPSATPPIRVGILHSLTGTIAISEQAARDATLMAIDEINAKGGLLGREIVPVVYRTKPQWDEFLDRLYREWGNQWANPGI